jgi:FkbM family methyltransferase
MPISSTLTEQLATLGVQLPAWPEEPENGGVEDPWIQRGQAYAEGVLLWRAQLRNAKESSKGVVDLLLQHQENSDQLTPWDRWLSSAIHQEVKKVLTLDRWKHCISLLKDGPLTRAQVLGASLALADSQQLAGATIGALRLFRQEVMSSEDTLEVCAMLISRSDAAWRIDEAETCPKAFQISAALSCQHSRLLIAALGQNDADGESTALTVQESVIATLERLLAILGQEDQWSGIPKARTLQIINRSGLDAALNFLNDNILWPVPNITREGHARMIAAQMLVESGSWKEVQTLNSITVAELKEYHEAVSMRTSGLEVIRTETDILSHELSIALSNGSLGPTAPSPCEGGQNWQRLSRSQLGQDLWVLEQSGWKKNGFFVEFGATDGVLLSNSWLLEKHFDWSGICAEPNPKFFERLRQNRSCILSSACVYGISGEKMRFVLADAYGGLEDHGRDDQHVDTRDAYAAVGDVIDVSTISLMDLLAQHGAPAVIDYLSIDTEGSELVILEGIDWSRYQFRCITVEHNFTEQRQGICKLLEAQGYQRQEEAWDDWYVKSI